MSAKPKVALPDDFQLTDARRSWARINTPGVDVQAEFDEFRDYVRARDWKMVDWEATWRNWLRKAKKRLPAWKAQQAAPARPQPTGPRCPVCGGQDCRLPTNVSPVRAFCNRQLWRALVKAGGVDGDTLARMVRAKNEVADAWDPHPNEITSEELQEKMRLALRKAYRAGEPSSTTR